MYWFTADQHFSHPWMATEYRGFSTIDTHDQQLVQDWVEVVPPSDVVVVLGDFYWGNDTQYAERLISKLPGNIIMVKGNHDNWWRKNKRHAYNKRIEKKEYVYGTHFPLRSWTRGQSVVDSDLGIPRWNIHGHCHGMLDEYPNQFDVGVDVAHKLYGKWRPFSIKELRGLVQKPNANNWTMKKKGGNE
jgi:calcineurin-like phosphoesterase family protein